MSINVFSAAYGNAKWVGISNYTKAPILTGEIKGTNIFHTVFFMPNLIGGIVLTVLPAVIIYPAGQKHIIKGVPAGAVKG